MPTFASWPEMIPSAGAISLAVADANEKFLGKLSYVWEQVDCGETHATAAIGRMMQAGIVDAVIGPECEASCETSGTFTAGHNIAQISYSCSSDLLSDKKKYPTVAPPSRFPLSALATTNDCLLCVCVGASFLASPFGLVWGSCSCSRVEFLNSFPSPGCLPPISEWTNLGCSSSAR